ncbi:MAG: chitobiase/beta-hexosaminidase C-terminal domain-containing protein [Bacteroidales bacterium]|nr:chitobiase/beta-hexosaminidase C-terminal domain-containing protein [Bacteroidales bacterium]
MKKTLKFLAGAAVAALTVVSCSRELENINDKEQAPNENAITIRVHATADEIKGEEPELKTYIDTYQGTANSILWGTDEYMILALTAGEKPTFATSTDASADLFDGDPEALFEFSVTPETASEYKYQGLYPASAAVASSNTNAANYKVNLPAIQNATASSYDPAAYIMVAKPETFATVQTDWEASFLRGTALNKITLKNFASSVEINKVKITAEGKQLAGGRHFNLTAGEGLEVYGTDNSIEVLYATPLSGTSMDVWFTSWGAEIAEGEKLTVVAYTTDNKSYTKEITVPVGRSIKFQEGWLNNTGVNMSGISPEDVTSLDGDYVILAQNSGNYYALKGEASGTRIASVDYSGSTSSYSGDASLVWTIATSGSGYTIKNGSNFIGWTSGNSADLVDENSYDATKCLMGIDDNGDGTYKIYVAADATRILARNTSNAYFAFYTGSGYNAIVLVPATAMEQVAIPTFSPAAGEVASGTEVSISCATSGATIYYTTDGSVPTTSSTQGNSVTITATTTIKAIAVKEGMANSEVATAQYTITGVTDYSVIETSNVTLTAGTNGSSATVNSEDAIKVGTSSKGGSMSVTVPAGTTKLHLHAAAWNGVKGLSLNISGATVSPDSIALTADSGISGNSPFALAGNPEDFYFVLELSDISADTDITFTSSIAKRFVVWGVNAEAGTPATPKVATPTISISGSDVSIACSTDGAAIYYTLDGSTPSTSSTAYLSSVSISGSQQKTIKAFATKSSYDDSEVAEETYYAINVNSTTNGTVTAIPYAAEGEEISLNVTPDSDYALDQLSVVDGSDNEVTVTNNKFTMPASPVTVSATFALIPVTTIADVLAGGAGTYEVPDVLVYAVKGSALIIGDATGKMYAYKSSHGLSAGDVRTVSGSTTVYNDVYEFNAPTFSGSGTATVNHGTAVEIDSQASAIQSAFANPSTAVYVHAIGSQSGRNITTTGNTALYLSAAENATDGKDVEIYGYVYAYSTSHSNFDILVTSIEEYVDPNAKSITALKSSITGVSADGVTNASESGVYSLTNASDSDVTVTPDGTIVTSASVSGGTLTYSVAANTGSARSGSVTLAVSGGNSITISISQLAGSGGSNPEPVVLIIDGSQLTSTATTGTTTKTYDGVSVTFSDGAKSQSSSGDNKFTSSAILIGKNGKNIHATVPGIITKFEIYANKGASAKVSVGVNFSSSAISSYNANAANTYTETLSTLDHVYDCSSSLPSNANSFWYQVTNANNSQVEFRITYTPSN